jgi:hypothetical protein
VTVVGLHCPSRKYFAKYESWFSSASDESRHASVELDAVPEIMRTSRISSHLTRGGRVFWGSGIDLACLISALRGKPEVR